MLGFWNRSLSFAAQHERRLGAVLFALGFLTDFFTFGILPVEIVNLIFLGYLALAAVCALGAQMFPPASQDVLWWRRAASVIFPLGVQYAYGGLLSGFVVFYTAHSVVAASWPFLLFVTLVYAGNEYFRMYKHYFVFQTTLFFFVLYAYAIFGLPLYLGKLGPLVFLGSTVAALLVFAAFLWLLYALNRARVLESARVLAKTCVGIVAFVSISYFSGFIPPIPLVLADSGMYHSLTRSGENYAVLGEYPAPWWHFGAVTVHHVPGEFLYAYSAVAAPVRFGSTIVHRWERKDDTSGWVTESTISFPIVGGREGGYRGYSAKGALAPGLWRVSVETKSGQVIGRIPFRVERAAVMPPLQEAVL